MSRETQRITIVVFLMLHTTAVSMTTKVTEVDQKNITHCKRCLEELRLLQEIKRKHIKLIDFQVWYFTTNKELFFKYLADE